MKTVFSKPFILLTLFTSLFISCDDEIENPIVINEEETITTVRLSVTEMNTTETTIYNWTATAKDIVMLKSNSAYNIKVEFLDESDPNDVENITEEVIAEKDEHFVFYDFPTNGLSYMSASDDTIDTSGKGIHISTDWTSTDAGSTMIKVFLVHQPTTKEGTTRADFGGDTDIEVTFETQIM